MERFAQLVEEKTEGRYTASIIAAGSLGTGSDMAQMLQMGTLDVLMSDDMTMDGVLDGALGFAWLPGLVADYEEADAYYNNGWIADKVAGDYGGERPVRSLLLHGFRQVGTLSARALKCPSAGLKSSTPP